MLALDIYDVRIAATAATNAVLLLLVPRVPVFVFLSSFPLIECSHFQVGRSFTLSCRCICGAMLNGRMPVSEVSEVMYIARCEKGASGEGVNRSISPLQ